MIELDLYVLNGLNRSTRLKIKLVQANVSELI